jgi:Histidine-specific methyltransferase, SAM-dependent
MPSLQASESGKRRIEQARNLQGWNTDDPRPPLEASRVLEPNRPWTIEGPFADGVSIQTWRRFLQGDAIRPESFKAFCEVLKLDFQEIIVDANQGEHSERTPPTASDTQVNYRIFISDRSQNPELNLSEQLQKALQETGREVIIAEDWLQRDNKELYEYDCFVLLVSDRSANNSDIILEEIQKAKQLDNERSEKTLTILLAHVGSLMSLPLNHNLHNELQGIPQLELISSTEPTICAKEILDGLKADNSSSVSKKIRSLKQNFFELKISNNWLLTYVGEDLPRRLSDLVCDLKNENERRIQSPYSYWGVGPTRMWTTACTDPCYHMRENIERFPDYARQLASHVDKERYNFVSLGVGEGSKDRSIISDFFNQDGEPQPRENFLYIPVDMSLDMLRVAVGRIQDLQFNRRIAIQKDIETFDSMTEIASIAQSLGQQQPILYGFLGNTIANVMKPEDVLNNIVQVMRTDDLLLFEAQIVDPSGLELETLSSTISSVSNEYTNIAFRQFVLSALLQNTDLSIERFERNRCYQVEVSLQAWKYGQILQIDCFFENNTGREIDITFATGDTDRLKQQERIFLLRSRKFTQLALQNFVEAMNLQILGQEQCLNYKETGFMVMMLQQKN